MMICTGCAKIPILWALADADIVSVLGLVRTMGSLWIVQELRGVAEIERMRYKPSSLQSMARSLIGSCHTLFQLCPELLQI